MGGGVQQGCMGVLSSLHALFRRHGAAVTRPIAAASCWVSKAMHNLKAVGGGCGYVWVYNMAACREGGLQWGQAR